MAYWNKTLSRIAGVGRLNKDNYDRLLAQHYNSWKVRTVTGLDMSALNDQQRAGFYVEHAERQKSFGVFHEAVLTGGRTTIENWARKDPRASDWRRVSDGDPCAFCAMLVTRSPVYTNRDKALHTTNPAKGIPTGTLHKYHPHCGCTVEVVYGDWQPTERERQWIDDYYRAAESLPGRTPRTAETVLPILRRSGGYRDSAARRSTPEYLKQRRAAYAVRKAEKSKPSAQNNPVSTNDGKRRVLGNGSQASRHDDGYWTEDGAVPEDNERNIARYLAG